MNTSLPPDDLFPRLTPLDRRLHQQLQNALEGAFHKSCSPILQSILSTCQWHFAISSRTLDFVLYCPNDDAYWQIIADIESIARQLATLTGDRAKICIFPPNHRDVSLQIEVYELLT